jgi:hypothetical protein
LRSRLSGGVGSYLNNIILVLKYRPGERTLSSVVDPIGIATMLDEKLDYICMTVVCGKH